MWQQSANPRGFSAGEGSSRAFWSTAARGRLRGLAGAALLLLAGLLAAPAAAQNATTVTITGSRPATFARVGQVLTFNVRLYTGNTPIDALTFTSGEPVGMSGLSCPGLPAGLMATTDCTFTYTTQPMDMAMGTIRALGRWRATRPGGTTRSSNTNTLIVSYAPPRAPDAPAIGTATAGNTEATVAFSAPDFDGGWPVDGYTVTSTPGGITATGTASPITVTGLTNGVAYGFTVTATNLIGTGASSAMSNSVTPNAPQSIAFPNPGTQAFGTAPTVTATASSGLAVDFSSGTTDVCTTTDDGVLAFVSAGTCTIHADQAGNAAFAAAARVSQSFTVNAVAPDAPSIGAATAGDAEATVTFTPPAVTGGAAITGYTVTSSPGGLTGSGLTSPITLAGLTNGTAYTFTVTATSSAGTSPASAASNSVVPSTQPVVTSVEVPADGLYGPGQALDFAVHWDQPVEITGTPGVALMIGASAAEATYVSGSGTAITRFRSTVLPGQSDGDGITVGALALNGGSIHNVPGRSAVLTLNSVASTAGVWVGVNNQAPVNHVPGAQAVEENGTLSFGAGNALSISDADADSQPLRVTLTVAHGQLALAGSAGLTFVSGGPAGGSSVAFEGALTDINAALNGLAYRPAPGYFGSDTLHLSTDDLGHTGFGGARADADAVAITVTPLDHIPPAAIAIDRIDGSPTRATGLRFSVAFSEDVAGVDASDFSLTGTGTATGAIVSVSAVDAAHYTVTVGSVAGDGALRLDLDAGTDIADAAGNGAAGFTAGQAYVLDNTAPAVTSVTVPADGQYLEGQHLAFTVHFSEAVTVAGTPYLPVTLNVGGGREARYTGGAGTGALSFDYTVAAGDQDLDGVVVGAALALDGGTLTDAVGNAAATTLNGVGDTGGVRVGLQPQAITGFAANPAAPVYAPGGTFAVSATGGASGNPLVFASTTAAVCSVAGNTVTMHSAGTCALTADQAGNANHEAAPRQTLDVVIGAGSQTLSFGAQAAQTFAPGGTFELSPLATASSGLPVSYSVQTPGVCTVNGSAVTMHSAGGCTVAVDQAGDGNYAAAAQVTQTIAIGKAVQAIASFQANPTAPVYAPGGTFAVSATGGASGNPLVFVSTTAAVCSVAGNTVTMHSAGTCALTADQAGNANYEAAPRQTLDVVIGKAVPTLSWAAGITKTFGESAFDLPDPASTGPGAFTFASSNAQVAAVDGRTVTITGAGTAVLTATQAASDNYAAASVTLLLTVDDRPDPTRDATVAAGLQGQVDASVRFAQAQQDNIRGRLGQLRSGRAASSNAVTLDVRGSGGRSGLSLGARDAQGDVPTMPQGWAVWTAGSVVLGERDAAGGRRGFEFRSDGVSTGIDRALGNGAVLGVAGGLGWGDTDLDDGRSSFDSRQRSLAVYGLWRSEAMFFDGIVGLGRLEFDLRRWSDPADAMAAAQREGNQRFASVTLGYESRGAHSTLTGYGRLDASRTTLDAYRETGLGLYDLQYATQDIESSTAAAGLEGRYLLRTASALIRPYWSLEWRQALQNQSEAGLNYVVMPGSSPYVLGLRSYDEDTLGVGAGVDLGFDSGWSLAFQVRREQSRDVTATAFGIHVSYGPPPRAPVDAEPGAAEPERPIPAGQP